jgi:Domain of unknown function (DUF4149)
MDIVSHSLLKGARWQTVLIAALAFWFSSSLFLDFVIMPGLYSAGMMSQANFAAAGYSIFWVFNRIELFCAALILTSVLVLQNLHESVRPIVRPAIVTLAFILFVISLVYTYALTPEMSALGLHLDLFTPSVSVPSAMYQMQQVYWALEAFKLLASAALLSTYYRTAS